MNTPVSYPLAKLLKEKGFNLKVIDFYDYERLSTPFDKQRQVDGLINYNPINWNSTKNHYVSAPTIADVVMWLHKEHKIWISVDPENDTNTWFYTISHNKSEIVFGNYSSLTEAYEKGIEHVLNNMI
jgi:hypothetical protein